MANVLTNRKIKIGAYNFPNRKSPVYALKKEIKLLFMGISIHLNVQKNL